MARTNQSFSMYSGEDKTIYVNIRDKMNKEVKLHGASLKWVMVQRGRDIASKDSSNGISIVDADKGRVAIRIKSEDTRGISGDCLHELRLRDADGFSTTVTTGKVSIEASLFR